MIATRLSTHTYVWRRPDLGEYWGRYQHSRTLAAVRNYLLCSDAFAASKKPKRKTKEV